jgi:hypothetical protein
VNRYYAAGPEIPAVRIFMPRRPAVSARPSDVRTRPGLGSRVVFYDTLLSNRSADLDELGVLVA